MATMVVGAFLGLLRGLTEPPAPRPPVDAGGTDAYAPGPWTLDRDGLQRAGELRRGGEIDAALVQYGRVARSLTARSDHRAQALYWHGRMRLERGEESALHDLRELVSQHFDPALLTRMAQTLERFAQRPATSARARAARTDALQLRARCVAALTAKSRVHDADGERARRWLKHLSP